MMLTGRTIEETAPPADAKPQDPPDGYVDPAAAVKVPKYSRREALAEAATKENPLLARSFVNYTWAMLMGRGIVHPVDEINSKHPASHPEMLEWLGRDFAAHNYDIRRLVRAIVLSRGYQLAAPRSRRHSAATGSLCRRDREASHGGGDCALGPNRERAGGRRAGPAGAVCGCLSRGASTRAARDHPAVDAPGQ